MRVGAEDAGRAMASATLDTGRWCATRAGSSFSKVFRGTPAASKLTPPPPSPEQPASPGASSSRKAVGTSFDERVTAMARRLHVKAGDLMAVMRFESGLRPDAINPTSHAVGLIQLLPRHAADLLGLPATSDREARAVEAFASMSADEQLDYVEAYFQQVLGGRGASNLRDAYMAVFYPAAIGRGDDYVIADAHGESAFGRAVYRQNAGLDVNGDGIVTAGEAAARVRGLRG